MSTYLQNRKIGFGLGLGITLVLAGVAKALSLIPMLKMLGPLVMAILLGMLWGRLFKVPEQVQPGVVFSTKRLLRFGIILLGMRLNLADVYHAGPAMFAYALLNLGFALTVVLLFSKIMGVDKKLGLLTACGTAICGAAAIAAVSPQIKASKNQTAISVAIIAVLGTLFTLLYTLFYQGIGMTAQEYGFWTGGTLHEIAHVIAAVDPAGTEAADLAVLVKLTRVALLVPVVLLIAIFMNRWLDQDQQEPFSWRKLPIPWFIFGFLAMSGLNTLFTFPTFISDMIISLGYFLIAMAMGGLGLGVDFKEFRRVGGKMMMVGLVSSILLSIFGYFLLKIFPFS
ncbi:putative integral membrane protein (TIGR00698 family) [Hazenella coriacea]|uniref:Putative integral membrane protein (TIGR00698 family) n=2 Tax=Hazenella coriacea TaxID=1179467 RepID=A0A4R3L4I3_9BACL|nr:YeiH family protein [Hazenella coriacea]TCS93878.1 putative integral membrane protein (TIGR00698 family) [Hazenella coriacea]